MEEIKYFKKNIKPFEGEKYGIWKFRILELLSEQNVIDVIVKEPPKDITEDWNNKERKARGLIVDYLGDSLLDYVKNPKTTAKEILTTLDAIYQRKSIAAQIDIRRKLALLKFKEDVSLLNHFSIFDNLMQESVNAGLKMDEAEKIAYLTLTMPQSYEMVITAIQTLSDSDLSLAFVKTRLLDQELKLKSASSDTSLKVLLAAQLNNNKDKFRKGGFNKFKKQKAFYKGTFNKNNYKNKNEDDKQKIYYYCGLKGHTKPNCRVFQRVQAMFEDKQNQRNESTSQENGSNDQSKAMCTFHESGFNF